MAPRGRVRPLPPEVARNVAPPTGKTCGGRPLRRITAHQKDERPGWQAAGHCSLPQADDQAAMRTCA